MALAAGITHSLGSWPGREVEGELRGATAIRSVFLSSYSGLGGGETSLRALLGALDRKTHQAALVTPRDGRLPEAIRGLGIETRVARYRGASGWFIPSVWARFPAVGRIEAALRELSARVVHSDFHSLPFALPACRRLGVPLVFTCHGWWFHPRPWQRAFFRNGPDATLAVSEAVRSGFLGRSPFMPPGRVRVIHLGVDTSRFRPRPEARSEIRSELGVGPDAPLVTLLARFQAVKGHDTFLESARRIADRFPDTRFVVAGESIFDRASDHALKRKLISRVCADRVLRDRVVFLGWVPEPERLLAASDVVVCSSRFESFGMALVEAMASEVPVVSTWVGGPAEIVADGETGFLVPPGRPDLIADRALVLLRDATLCRRMGQTGRRRVQERFELGRYADAVSDVLRSLAG